MEEAREHTPVDSFPTVTSARIASGKIVVVLDDGREIATPLSWYPVLRDAPADALEAFEVSPFGLHWPHLDEDLSVAGMLAGRRGVGRLGPEAA